MGYQVMQRLTYPSLPTGHILQFWGTGTRGMWTPQSRWERACPSPVAALGPTPPPPQPQQPRFAPISVVLSSRECPYMEPCESGLTFNHSSQLLETHSYSHQVLCCVGSLVTGPRLLPAYYQEPHLGPVGGCSKHWCVAFCVNLDFRFSG